MKAHERTAGAARSTKRGTGWAQHYERPSSAGLACPSPPARTQSDLTRFCADATDSYKPLTATRDSKRFEPDLGDRFAKGLFFEDERPSVPPHALAEAVDADWSPERGHLLEQCEADPDARVRKTGW